MTVDLLELYQLIGREGGKTPPVTPELTAKLVSIVVRVECCQQAAACIRAFLNRYPEEGLVQVAIERFFALRCEAKSDLWAHELNNLLYMMKRGYLRNWLDYVYRRMRDLCPGLITSFFDHDLPMLDEASV